MKLKKLIETYRRCKPYRSEYYIKQCVKFAVDSCHYHFVFIPTISWLPWPYRWPGAGVIEIRWLNMSIVFGEWRHKGD